MSGATRHLKKLKNAHIILFAIFPILSLYSANLGELYFRDTYRSFIAAILLSFLITSSGKLVLGTWGKAALFTSPILVYLFAYGHIYNEVEGWRLFGVLLGRHRYLLALGLAIIGGWGWIIKTRIKEVERFNVVFLSISLTMLALPIFELISQSTNAQETSQLDVETTISLSWEGNTEELPDIYYIIVDGYARSDTLAAVYNWDNTDFLEELQQQGFFIADQSYSNYSQTMLALSANLNLEYVNELIPDIDIKSEDRSVLQDLVHHSLVRDLLYRLDYQMIAFDTALPGTSIEDADLYWETSENPLLIDFNSFEGKLADTTILQAVLDSQALLSKYVGEQIFEPGYEAHRTRTLSIFNWLSDPASLNGHYFVFAHIVSPHPPFVFGLDGERLTHHTPFDLLDGNHFEGSQDEYLSQYRNQAIFISQQILETVNEILESSSAPPIIIIQADHGPGAYLLWDNMEDTNLHERFAILNAIYFPGGDLGQLYPQISPVNTFRVVFNRYFSSNLPLLPDRSFFSDWETPFDLIDITSELR